MLKHFVKTNWFYGVIIAAICVSGYIGMGKEIDRRCETHTTEPMNCP